MDREKIPQEKEKAHQCKETLMRSLGLTAVYSPKGELLSNSDEVVLSRLQLDKLTMGYVVGRNLLNVIRYNQSCITNEEYNDILNLDEYFEDETEKDYHLMQICKNASERQKNHTRNSAEKVDIEKVKAASYKIKADNIAAYSGYIAEAVNRKNNLSYKQLMDILSLALSDVSTMLYSGEGQRGLFDYDADRTNIYNKIQGMRHEAAFKEMIYGIECKNGLIEVVETDDEADSHGVDMILNVKLSGQKNNLGLFEYASPSETESSDYQIRSLRIDVKSSPVNDAFAKQKSKASDPESRKKLDTWKIWSHVYDDDFRLSLDNGVPFVLKDDKKVPIYLNDERQFEAMEKLNVGNSLITYKGKEGTFLPGNLSTRHSDIMREVLFALNTLPEEATEHIGV